ncbi:MAG: MBL fold metallo-hydrolase [Synergistaceae bacterium]|nr:MBL fold metallo-hydrolase [Synergistaceae bacterium]
MRGKKSSKLLLIALFLVAAVFSFVELPNFFSGGVSFYAFDVGQADSFLLHFPGGENVLVDAGARKTSQKLVSKLKRLGVKKIDILIATHPHEDHIGGMKDVIESFEIGKTWDSGFKSASPIQRDMLKALRDKNIRFGRPRAGHVEKIGDAEIEVIAPLDLVKGTKSDANNNSIVIRVSYGKISFLMTGDIEEAGRAFVRVFPGSTILKVSHHGSANGTDERLLSEVRPEIAILSYGSSNQYGHPHRRTMELLKKHGIKSYATVNGDIVITTDGKTFDVKQEGGAK